MVGAFSFPKSQRSDPKKDPTPGVGNYDPDRPTNMKPPTWKIGSEQRGKLGQIRAPGPGQYEQKEDVIKRKKPEFSFGGKYYHQTASQITPGPGAYDPDERKLLQSASSFSIRPRLQPGGVDDYLRETKNGPGPAAYETNYSTLYRPSSRIGNQQRDGLYNSSKWVPGVGNYNVRPQTSGPFHRFGGALRDNQFIKDKMTPGPGEYMIQSTLNTKATTMSTKRLGTGADSGPGPGQYDPSVILTKRGQPYVGIGTGIQRQNFGRSQTPGPGQYTHQNPNKRRPPSYK
ncbi:Outer dense fiber protein 3-like protein 2 [Paramecium bursaria]